MTRTVTLRKRGGEVVCERCGLADRMLPRMRGLLGRRSLERDEGLLLRPAPSIQTFFMRFPIDAVFLDREGTVLKVRAALRPWRFAGCRGAHATLELAAGAAQQRAIGEGDRIELAGALADVHA
jgi:uncharacterized membrane protein (UPF0127 family)